MEPIAVRLASMDDAAAICTIYNQGIEDRVATLETELRDADERRRWLSSRGARHPVVVAEAAGRVIAPKGPRCEGAPMPLPNDADGPFSAACQTLHVGAP